MQNLEPHHQAAAEAVMHCAPNPNAKAAMHAVWNEATAAKLPWAKLLEAFATAAAGGFTFASIAAAIAILWPTSVPPALQHLTGANVAKTTPAALKEAPEECEDDDEKPKRSHHKKSDD